MIQETLYTKEGKQEKKFTLLFSLAMLFLAQAQMMLSEILISQKLALPYLTKRCLKCQLGRVKYHLAEVSEFSSQYFPRKLFPKRVFSILYPLKRVLTIYIAPTLSKMWTKNICPPKKSNIDDEKRIPKTK